VERKRQQFLKHELAWVRRGPSARRTKSVDRIERYFEEAAKAPPEQEIDVELIIPPAPKLANRIITLTNVGMALAGRTLFDSVNLDLAAGQRLGIVGRNGLGKSTLLKVMIGELAPTHGEVEIGARTQINYVDQNRLALDDEKTVCDEVGEGHEYVRLGEESITLRGYLRRFLFTEDRINTKIAQLSGGERSRILLAKILKRGGNVLILDEPTNDLDLATLRLLEEALLGFGGAVIVVSHDRYFLNRVCTHTMAFEGDGLVTLNAGGYEYYLEKRRSLAGPTPAATPRTGGSLESAAPKRARKLTYKETRELETIEADILAAEAEVARIEEMLSSPDAYRKYGEQWAELDAQLIAARERVPRLYARWEELEAIQRGTGL
jgi:ATP-binding cassette subfamily F protein uup